MNTMTLALRDAGVAIPQRKRIWNWLKDNGPHTSIQIAKALNINYASAASVLSDMVFRDMLHREHVRDARLPQGTSYFRVNPTLREYEVLPLQAKPKRLYTRKPKETSNVKELIQKMTTPQEPLVEPKTKLGRPKTSEKGLQAIAARKEDHAELRAIAALLTEELGFSVSISNALSVVIKHYNKTKGAA